MFGRFRTYFWVPRSRTKRKNEVKFSFQYNFQKRRGREGLSTAVDSWMEIWPLCLWSNANATKKIIICGNISPVIALWADIFIVYMALNPTSTFLHQFYLVDLANFEGSKFIFFLIAALVIRCDGPGCCPSWGISSLTSVSDGIFFPLPLLPKLFRTYFAVTYLWTPRH